MLRANITRVARASRNTEVYVNYKNTLKFAMTEYKQQLGKLLLPFAASSPYSYHAALQNRCPK